MNCTYEFKSSWTEIEWAYKVEKALYQCLRSDKTLFLLNKAAAFLVNKFDSPLIEDTVPDINKEGLKLANMLRESTVEYIKDVYWRCS